MVKLQMKIGGCWRSLRTAARYCLVRSYLTTAGHHAIHRVDAIRNALTDFGCHQNPQNAVLDPVLGGGAASTSNRAQACRIEDLSSANGTAGSDDSRMKTVLVSGCLVLGTVLVLVQVVHSFAREHARAAIADLARSVSAMAESTADAVDGTNDAVGKLQAVHEDVSAKGGVPVEMTQAIQDVASATGKAKTTSEAARAKAEDVAKQATSVTSLLGDLSGRLPFAVMGLVFIIAGAWIGGMIDLSVMTKPQ